VREGRNPSDEPERRAEPLLTTMTYNVFVPPKYLVTGKSAGFAAQKAREIALYCRLGAVRERESPHRLL
jgi:hypothetical protein